MKSKVLPILICLILLTLGTLTACKGPEGTTPDEIATTVTESTKETKFNSSTASESVTEATQQTEDTDTPAAKPVDRVETEKTATVTVGDKDYTVNVGDRIVYTCYLKTPESIENIQASVSYDNTALWFRQAKAKEMFPNLHGVIYNANITGLLLFNASEPVEGFDFTQNGTLVSLEFDVAKEGSSSIATAIEFMDEMGGASYVDSFNIVGNITISETLS